MDIECLVISHFDTCYFLSTGGGRGYSAVLGVPAWKVLSFGIIADFLFLEFVQRIGASVGTPYQSVFDAGSQLSCYYSDWYRAADVATMYGEWHYLG